MPPAMADLCPTRRAMEGCPTQLRLAKQAARIAIDERDTGRQLNRIAPFLSPGGADIFQQRLVLSLVTLDR
jgi:hypothetical protein